MPGAIVWEPLGPCTYARALALQEARWEARRSGGPDACLAVEHPPTVTLGRRATDRDLHVERATLAARGVACVRVDRGGRATYHGPGQLVLYPIVGLAARGLAVPSYVWMLEEIMIAIAARVGVRAVRDARGRGVWARGGKLGAVGIRVRRGVATHGLALNVACDLDAFTLIEPCGMRDVTVTSLRHEGAHGATWATAAAIAAEVCAETFAPAASQPLRAAAR